MKAHLTKKDFALRYENAFAEPTECSDASFGLRHVAGRPTPGLIADEPTDRPALQVRLIVRSHDPERHAVGEVHRGVALLVAVAWKEPLHRLALVEELLKPGFRLVFRILVGLVEPQRGTRKVGDDVAEGQLRRGGLRCLHRRDDRDQSHPSIHQSLHDLTDVR